MQATQAFRQRRYREAAAGYEQCVARSPGSPRSISISARLRELSGDLPGAIGAYLDAFRLNPKDGRLALFAGAALEAAGRRDAAATLFSLGDDIDPAVRRAKDRADLDPEIRRRSAVADSRDPRTFHAAARQLD